MSKKSDLERGSWPVVKLFLKIFLPVLLLIVVVTGIIYYFETRNEKAIIEIQESLHVELLEKVIMDEFEMVVSDLKVLATRKEVSDFLERDDGEALMQEVLAFSKIKGLYDQVRFLDETGLEIIRVNYNNGEPVAATDEGLQFKGERYYFKETIKLDRGEVYVSPFDLNIENKEVEQPIKPMIRFAVPMFDKSNQRRGILVVNYLGENLLKDFRREADVGIGHSFLLNADGYWLRGMKPEDEWGFMYEDKQDLKFEKEFPEAGKTVLIEESGQVYVEGEGLFTFTTIKPLEGNNDYYWKIVDNVMPEILKEKPRQLLTWLGLIDGLLIVIVWGSSWMLAKSMVGRKRAEKKILELNEILKLLNKILRHDILNDLTVVGGNIDMYLQYGKEKVDVDQTMKEAAEAIKRDIKFIGQMRELEGAVSSGKKLEPIKVQEVVQKVAEKFKNMRINIEGEATVLADQALESVMTNLVRNANVHGQTDRVDVKIVVEGKIVRVVVVDDGKGIPDEIKSKLFVEGFKYGETGHSGLGLYIVKKTIERYGGSVVVEDNRPKGTMFVLRIPKAKWDL